MGRSRFKAAAIALFAAALVAAPGAFSATPQEIYQDYADNGQLDKQYSPADLERVLKDAAVQQYGPGTVGGGLTPEVEEEIDDTPTGGSSPGGDRGWPGGRRHVAGPVERRSAVHRARSQSDRGRGPRVDPAGRSAAARRQAEGVRPRATVDGARWRPRSIHRGLTPSPTRHDRECARPRCGRSRASLSTRRCCFLQPPSSSSEGRPQA